MAIGIGICTQKAGQESHGSHPYRIVDHGRWEVSQGANWIESEQTITDAGGGYGYIYRKRLTLVPAAAELVIDYTLVNTGAAAIVTDVYNHNLPAVISGLVTVLLWKQFYEPSERGALNALVLHVPAIAFVGREKRTDDADYLYHRASFPPRPALDMVYLRPAAGGLVDVFRHPR